MALSDSSPANRLPTSGQRALAAATAREAGRSAAGLWIAMAAHAVAWVVAAGFGFFFVNRETGLAITFLGGLSLLVIYLALRWSEHRKWIEPLQLLAHQIEHGKTEPDAAFDRIAAPQIAEVGRSIRDFQLKLRETVLQGDGQGRADRSGSGELAAVPSLPSDPALTASGLYAGIHDHESGTTELNPVDIISQLHPSTLQWLSSTPAEESWIGLPFQTLRQSSYLDIVHPDDRVFAEEQIRRAITKGDAYALAYRIRNSKGEDREVEVDVSLRFNRDGSPRYVRLRTNDVTEKVKADRELRRKTRELADLNAHLKRMNRDLEELGQRYVDLYHNVPVMYFSLDGKCRISQCNDTLVKTLGYSRDSLLGRRFSAIVDPLQQEDLRKWFEELKTRGTSEVELRWIKADGSSIDVWLASTVIAHPDGKFASARNVARDETERLRLEAELKIKNDWLEAANAQLVSKNRELDEFSYVVSHDLQEPVRTLINFSEFLLQDHGNALDESGREYLNYIGDASRRLRALIKDLLAHSRVGRVAGEFKTVDLNEVARIAAADLTALIQAKHAEVNVIGTLPFVEADRDRIVQLLSNLIGNGIKYNRSETPRVEISAEPGDSGLVAIKVRDNGIGIAPQYHQRIFELFRQLHPRGEFEGTGAGLAISRKIVQAHGGTIHVESPADGGTAFVFTLRSAVAPPKDPGEIS